jgi:putative membrane protein
MEWFKTGIFLNSVIFALLGVAVFWFCFMVIDKLTPYSLWTELVEKRNIALAIVAAAVHG